MNQRLPEPLREIQNQMYNVAISTGLGVLKGLEDDYPKGDLVSLLIGTHISIAAFFMDAAGFSHGQFLDGVQKLMDDMREQHEKGDPSTSLFGAKPSDSTVN